MFQPQAKTLVVQQQEAAPEPEPKFELNEEEWVYKGDPNDRKARTPTRGTRQRSTRRTCRYALF